MNCAPAGIRTPNLLIRRLAFRLLVIPGFIAISKTKSILFNISSNNTSLNGSFKSKLLLELPDLSFHNEVIETIYISIQHAEIPASWYNVNYTNLPLRLI